MKKNPNPQGKGLVPVLSELSRFKYQDAEAKSLEKISSEIFTALFVLKSEFSFCPRSNQDYYLYQKEDRYFLSLLSPKEWGVKSPYPHFIGTCQLHSDMAWSINLDENLDPKMVKQIENKFNDYKKELSSKEKIDELLPGYIETCSFYQRALIWSLGQSLRVSMGLSGYLGRSVEEVKLLEQKKGP